MDFIIKGMHQGKTRALVQKSAETKIPILGYNSNYIRYLKKIATEEGIDIPEPINIDNVKNQTNYLKIHNIDKIYIDDLDITLKEILGAKIDTITIGAQNVRIY